MKGRKPFPKSKAWETYWQDVKSKENIYQVGEAGSLGNILARFYSIQCPAYGENLKFSLGRLDSSVG